MTLPRSAHNQLNNLVTVLAYSAQNASAMSGGVDISNVLRNINHGETHYRGLANYNSMARANNNSTDALDAYANSYRALAQFARRHGVQAGTLATMLDQAGFSREDGNDAHVPGRVQSFSNSFVAAAPTPAPRVETPRPAPATPQVVPLTRAQSQQLDNLVTTLAYAGQNASAMSGGVDISNVLRNINHGATNLRDMANYNSMARANNNSTDALDAYANSYRALAQFARQHGIQAGTLATMLDQAGFSREDDNDSHVPGRVRALDNAIAAATGSAAVSSSVSRPARSTARPAQSAAHDDDEAPRPSQATTRRARPAQPAAPATPDDDETPRPAQSSARIARPAQPAAPATPDDDETPRPAQSSARIARPAQPAAPAAPDDDETPRPAQSTVRAEQPAAGAANGAPTYTRGSGAPPQGTLQAQLLDIGVRISQGKTDPAIVAAVEAFYRSTGDRAMEGLGRLTETEMTAVLNRMQSAAFTPGQHDELQTLGSALGINITTLPAAATPPTPPATPVQSERPGRSGPPAP